MRNYLIFALLLGGLILITVPFSAYLKQRPVAIKLGYTPKAEIMKIAAGEHRYLLAEVNFIRVLFYFGSLYEEYQNRVVTTPEYAHMYNTLLQSIKLDPYNQDIYYFSQATFTWDVGRAAEVNRLLDYGMKYRTNDYNLPFWAGFNSAYFLNDYAKAAFYMQKAAEISGSPMYTKLAARFFHESGRNDLGVIFLETMANSTKNKKVRESYLLRKKTLVLIRDLQLLVHQFKEDYGVWPERISALVLRGYLASVPVGPYGGKFFIDESGVVKTSSNLTFVRDPENK